MITYSQNNEQEIILDYFKDFIGNFCDIGANDGKTFSNTAALINLGWSGCMIEPTSGAYNYLNANYHENPYIETFKCAIGDKTELKTFYVGDDSLLSTFDITIHTDRTKFHTEEVPFFSWEDFNKGKQPFDFISVDAEGLDWAILQQIDLTNVKMLCIEYWKYKQEIKEYCNKFDMKLLYENGENLIFVK